ncbi:MAG: LytTR family DNA-binding domain-containing protein [Bacteroidota bacterium]
MRILLIEDEQPAAEKLMADIRRINARAEIEGPLRSVREILDWLESHPSPDLIVADIQLRDGTSLDAFRKQPVTCPVIFATAYDEYLLEVLEHNSIDYLLKPVHQDKLERALRKYMSLREHFVGNVGKALEEYFGKREGKRNRIAVRKGTEFISVPVEDIAFFHTEHKVVFLVDKSGSRHIVDRTLSDLETELDGGNFFRANRKFIVSIRSLKKFKPLEKGKILLDIHPPPGEQVIVSQESAAEFRKWAGK